MELTQAVPSAPSTPPTRSSQTSTLSEGAFKQGIGLLTGEYHWKPDAQLLKRWWRQVKGLTDEGWNHAIDSYMLGQGDFHPHPGQLVALATQYEQQQRLQEATTKARAEYKRKPKSERGAAYWGQRIRQEEQMGLRIRAHLQTKLGLNFRKPEEGVIPTRVITEMMDDEGLCGEGRIGQLQQAEEIGSRLLGDLRAQQQVAEEAMGEANVQTGRRSSLNPYQRSDY